VVASAHLMSLVPSLQAHGQHERMHRESKRETTRPTTPKDLASEPHVRSSVNTGRSQCTWSNAFRRPRLAGCQP
jgi:hypothetical protein